MNRRLVVHLLGGFLLVQAAVMAIPLLFSLVYHEDDALAFAYTIGVLLIFGLPAALIKPRNRDMHAREGFAIVALGWLLLAGFGALPYVFSGAIPRLEDAWFESVSGFTTTGSTILTDIEALPHGLLFWRSATHWLGGMGVLLLTLAVMPMTGAKTIFIMRAESPGPAPGKITPRMAQNARILYLIYGGLSLVMFVALLICGLTPFDALIHTMSTAGTGGFSNMNASVAAYASSAVHWVITAFMLLFSMNFALFFQALRGDIKSLWKNDELRWFAGIVLASAALISLNIAPSYERAGTAIRDAAFQVSSVISTTGFVSADFNLWPPLSRMLLLALMIVGACAGSTGGGVKVVRVMLTFRYARRGLSRQLHPRQLSSVRMDGRPVEDDMMGGVVLFLITYIAMTALGSLILAAQGYDMTTSVTSAITAIGNVGPGLGPVVGPVANFASLNAFSKLTLTLLMLLGRLEIFPLLVLLSPGFWRRG